jgi:large subunit ribosomal protein L15
MQLDSMKPAPGSRRPRKRLGPRAGYGHRKTTGKGHKGARARSGGGPSPGFEGGQMPLQRRLPKRGFKNPNRVAYQVVNLSDLALRFEAGEVVDPETLMLRGLATRALPVKILGKGTLDVALTVRADAFSGSARSAIEKAGGTAATLAELMEGGQQ